MSEEVRIDKYLWAIRMYKTRSLASEALDGGKVKMNGATIKASKKVKLGEIYTLRRDQQILEIEVVAIIDKRVAAPIAQTCYKEISNEVLGNPKQENSAFFTPNITREKGKGRPTKRERRDIDDFLI